MVRSRLALLLTVACVLAIAVGAAADNHEIAIAIEKNRFQPREVKVKAGAPFTLVVTNKDATPEEFESKPLQIEKVIPGGKTVKIPVKALKPGTYPFVGEYHQTTAQGRIVVE